MKKAGIYILVGSVAVLAVAAMAWYLFPTERWLIAAGVIASPIPPVP
jgi:hypothetical protein